MEMVLCFYESSSRLVERIFKGSREGACRWMEAFMKLKKVRQFEALYTGCACRCLETLIFALSTSSDILVLEHLVDLIVDGWDDLVMDTNASHFIRSFIRVLFGLPKFERSLAKGPSNEVELLSSEWTNKEVELKKRVRNFIANIQLKRIFEKVVNLALDYNLMKGELFLIDYLGETSF
ncbi:unnamed protein product [Toxocara canis]|uniref:E3 ubiquitin-protein ligase listerin n=1 Tax=Toxocara canis TaxID=6265 RepID=A0A183U716_TOXCA|nr:unnamed protein product [Toxocara canis]